MKNRIRLLGIFLAFAIAAPVNAEQQRRGGREAQYAAVQAFHDHSVALFNADDLEGSLNDYLPTLRVLSTLGDKITDHDNMKTSWAGMFKTTRPYLISEVAEMEVNGDDVGDWAYMLCRYAAVTFDKESGEQIGDYANGRYIALMEMTEDGWKVLLDIDNGASGAAIDLEEQLKARFTSK